MPRLQAPRGYYTATEVKKLLNVSDPVIRAYANSGKIKYVIPPGRKQGFYSKNDVDRIVNEIRAFISMSEDELEFKPAHKEDLPEITRIANSFFSLDPDEQLDNNPTAPTWSYEALSKNPETEFALKIDGSLIGFIGTLPLRADIDQDIDKWNKLLTVDRIADVGLTTEDIEQFEPGKHIHLFITGIGVDKDLESTIRKNYGAKLISRYLTQVVELGKRGVIVDKVTAGGATATGIRLLLAFGLHEIPPRTPGKRIFTMDVQESGSPVCLQYKEALAEWKQQHKED